MFMVFLLINALNLADKSTKEKLIQWIKTDDKNKEQDKIKGVTNIYNHLKLKKLCEIKIDEYVTKAKQNLFKIDVPKEKKRELNDLIINLSKRID